MDDEAASQQLMSEARATHATDYANHAIPLQLDGASQNTIANTPGSSAKKGKKPRRKQPASQTESYNTPASSALPSYSLQELQAFVGPSPSKSQTIPSTKSLTKIESPGMQTGLQSDRVPSSTSATASQAVATGSSSRKKSKKRKQMVDSGLNDGIPDEAAQTNGGSPSVVLKAPKPRRKAQALGNQAERADTTPEQDVIPATPYDEVVEPVASRKRRKTNKSKVSGNSVDLQESFDTPTATQEEAPDATAADVSEIQDAGDEPLLPMTQLENMRAERSQLSRKKGPTADVGKLHSVEKVPESIPAQDFSPERSHRTNQYTNGESSVVGNGVDAGTTDAPISGQTPKSKRSKAEKRKVKKGQQVVETPVEVLREGVSPESSRDEMAEPSSDNDKPESTSKSNVHGGGSPEPSNTSRKSKSSKRKKASRPSIGGVTGTPRKRHKDRTDPNRNYQRERDDDDRTAAEIALESSYELRQPPDKRTSGEWTADEKELIRRAIKDYQERNGLEVGDLVEIIQWSHARKREMAASTTYQTEAENQRESDALWDDIKSAGLLRKLSDIKKHVRMRYHSCQRGHWSEDDDESLRQLANLYPGNWKLIATHLNRLELDVYNRWKDYVRHGENRITKRWSRDEEENFVNILSTVCQRVEDHRAEIGKPPLDDYTPVVNWHEVCREMGDTRSRLQCQSKWKLMRAREPPAKVDVEIKPRKAPQPGQPVEDEIPQKKRRQSKHKSNGVVAGPLTLGPENMLWGDRFDLLGHVIEQASANECETDSQIVWRDIAEKMDWTWSVRTLQTAYGELRGLVEGEEESLMDALSSVYRYMVENHESEMEDRYEAGGVEVDEVESSGKKGKKKGGRATRRQKEESGSRIKSSALITESDDAASDAAASEGGGD